MSRITDNNYCVAGNENFPKEANANKETTNESKFREALEKRKEEILEKIEKGETEPSFPLGAQTFTVKQWNKLVERVDEAIEDMRETAEQKKEDQEQQIKEKKANSITLEMLAELLGIGIQEESEET